jgi:adenylate cyclase
MQVRQIRHLTRLLVVVLGAFLAVLLGVSFLTYSFAEPLVRLSYDVPFLWRAPLDTHDVILVYLDESSAKELNQPVDDVWNRQLHVQLLKRLTADQARLVFFDITFSDPREPASDAAFAEAIRANGHVVLGASLEINERDGVRQERVVRPIKLLREAARGSGLLVFRPVDADYGVRQIYLGTDFVPSATWKAAEILQAKITQEERKNVGTLWLNYYGPHNDLVHGATFRSVSLAQAISPDSLPPGFFRDKIILVGGQFSVGDLRVGRDEFATPYSRSRHEFTPGSEVHANILLNLLRGEWLTRLSWNTELLLVIIAGLVAGCLSFLRPIWATILTILICAAIAVFACSVNWNERVWFAWLVPAAVQLPLGLAWCVTSQYLLESRRRKELRKAFGFYLSPEMADRIADSDFDLHPGGKVVEATVIFTDLENFTTLSEDLDPAEVSRILIAYFEQTTSCILKNRGTIIKYVGDAVMAAWGAPIDEPAHAVRAAEAACDLRCLTELDVHGKKLRTRIGVNSGKVLAGNLGSSFRFDYTMIGDTTNFASRLESLNKYLKTQVLISDSVKQQLEEKKFVTRRLGAFKVAGKTQSVLIHELICRCAQANGEMEWIATFEEGLTRFGARDFAGAAELMKRTTELRGRSDGPAEFYLRKISALQDKPLPADWAGVVEFTEK